MKNCCYAAVRFINGCKSVRHSASSRVPIFWINQYYHLPMYFI